MRRAVICLWMMIKRMGKHPVYWGLLALFPAALFAVTKFNRAVNDKQISVGYVMEDAKLRETEKPEYSQGENERQEYDRQLLGAIECKLSEGVKKDDLFQYKKYTGEEEMIEDILTGELSCGIVFDVRFAEKFRKQDYGQSILMYLPEGMNVGGMVQEDIFQRIYQAGSAVWYADLLGQKGYQVEAKEVLEKFSEYQNQGKVFSVKYEVQEGSGEKAQNTAESEKKAQMLSLRGVLAFLAFLAASLGALDGSRDKKSGAGKGIASPGMLMGTAVAAPIIPAILFLAGGMLFSEMPDGFIPERILQESGSALLYGFILWLLAVFFSRLLPEKFLEGIMPCFLLITLLCCPVLFDLGGRIALVEYLSKAFPITWYLAFWN